VGQEGPTQTAWIFSGGPLGSEPVDDQGRDRLVAAMPEDATRLEELIHPRDHRVFFGALNPDDLSILPRLLRILPAGRRLLEEGDFRDWDEIETWADLIAGALSREQPASVGASAGAGGRIV
jgi:menaquinone-dependent protoporphyrinogen oxidase